MSTRNLVRGAAFGTGLLAAVCLSVVPASAQGFFEQLFGLQPAAPAYAPPASPDMAPPASGAPQFKNAAPVHHRRKVAVVTRPNLQETTDIMHDKTLRVGDAVMMKDGLHVYNGPETSRHTRQEFVGLDDTDSISPAKRADLASLDVTRANPVMEGRADSEIVNGFKITDARGRSIRYVGPF